MGGKEGGWGDEEGLVGSAVMENLTCTCASLPSPLPSH